MTKYLDFIKRKATSDPATGLSVVPALNPMLHQHQADMVRWALHRGRAAIFADCGLGKGPMQMEWATRQPHDALIVAPLAVAHQFVREAEKFGVDLAYAKDQSQITKRITVTNYERIENFHIEQFGAVALDECFPAGTLIDCVVDGVFTKKHIEKVQIGDRIVNAVGVDRVADVHRREVQYAVKVKVKERSFIASPNHPVFTQRGWVGAQDLRPGDYALAAREALSLVRGGVFSEVSNSESAEILRDILLSEVAHDAAGCIGESAFAGRGGEARGKEICMASLGRPESDQGDGTDQIDESNIQRRNASENLPHIENHEAQTFRTWWKREGDDGAASVLDGTVAARMDSGICLVTGETKGRLSNLLQARLSEQRNASVHRGGWTLAQCEEGSGREENYCRGIFRVEGLEILEQGNPELERFRDAEGRIYFYDLGATRHPSFSVNGLLVHNSSILKNSAGAYSNWMIDAFKSTPFRLCSSATPAPNDVMELGTQAEFLGVMTRSEMLAMYFTHDGGDTSKWRVKGHAQAAFWSWMASWAVMIRKPSDLGYSDEGFTLPPLHMHEQCVSVTAPTSGFLFAVEAQTLQERQQARRDSIGDRVKACADLINGSGSWANQEPSTGANTTQQTSKSDEQTSELHTNDTRKQGKQQTSNGLQMPTKKKSKSGIGSSTSQISIDTKKQEGLQPSGNMALMSSNSVQCSNHKAANVQFADATQKTAGNSILTTITQQGQSEEFCATHATSYSEGTKTIQSGCQITATNHLPSTSSDQWLVWTNLNEESRQVAAAIPDAVEITGSDSDEFKEWAIAGFLDGSIRVLVSKPRIIGVGLNLQCCSNMAYVGLSDSYEQLYQSIRRCWRFGQTRPVNVHIITAETEGAVVSNIKRKEREAEETYNSMVEHMKDLNAAALHGQTVRNKSEYAPTLLVQIPSWMEAA